MNHNRQKTALWWLLLIDTALSVVIGQDDDLPLQQPANEDGDDPEPNPHGPSKPGGGNDDDPVQHYALIIFATVCAAAVIAAVTIIIVCYCRRRAKERKL